MDAIRWESTPGERVIHLAGELDVDVWNRIEPEFRRAVGVGESDVLVRLDDVRFTASRGIGLLIEAHQLLRGKGRRLRVAGPRPNVRRLFDAVGLTKLLEVE